MKNFNRNKAFRKYGNYNACPLPQQVNMPIRNENGAIDGQAIPWTEAPIMHRYCTINPLIGGTHHQPSEHNMDTPWYALNNSPIGCLFTALSDQQIKQQFGVYAKPNVSYLAIDLPPGMLSLEPEPQLTVAEPQLTVAEPRKSIQFISKDNNNANVDKIDHFDMVPLASNHLAPVQHNMQNITFQAYRMMTLTVNEAQSQRPDRIVYDVSVSPMYPIDPRQQQRLQNAMQQANVPLSDALLPVVEDLYADYRKRYVQSVQKRSKLLNDRVKNLFKCTNHKLRLTDTIMALDANGQYQPMVFSEWGQRQQASGAWEFQP